MAGKGISSNETRVGAIAAAVRELFQGRSHAVGQFTLEASATSTVVTAPNVGTDSRIALTPQTANAAAALASTYIDQADVVAGAFTVHHANNAQTDRTFSYSVRG